MSSNQFDLAVFGSSPTAHYLAALLAEGQTRRIVLVHDPATRIRLPRGLCLSAGLHTRPETWRLLAASTAETLRRLKSAGLSAALERLNLGLVRHGAAGRLALGHLRALASAHGLAVERLPAGEAAHALVVRDIWRFAAERSHDAFAAWHKKLGVERLLRSQVTDIAIGRDGALRMATAGRRLAASLAILADDESIIEFAAESEINAAFRTLNCTAFLTEPVPGRLPGRAGALLGEDFVLMQYPSGALAAIGAGASGPLAERILRTLPFFADARIAGRARFHALVSADGAPQIGRGNARRAFLVGGLGETGFCLVPSLARFIAGEAAPGEKAFWSARALPRAATARVDDIAALEPGAA